MKVLETTARADERLVPLSWTASEKRVYTSMQAADYLVVAGDSGHVLRGLEFTLRPDYRFDYWRAGFMLVPRDQTVGAGRITDTCLFHIAMNSSVEQPRVDLYLNGGMPAETGLRFYSKQIPAFVVRANIWPVGSDRAGMAVSVDNADCPPLVVSFDLRYAERVVLLAWADGKIFKIYFDDIKVYWEKCGQP